MTARTDGFSSVRSWVSEVKTSEHNTSRIHQRYLPQTCTWTEGWNDVILEVRGHWNIVILWHFQHNNLDKNNNNNNKTGPNVMENGNIGGLRRTNANYSFTGFRRVDWGWKYSSCWWVCWNAWLQMMSEVKIRHDTSEKKPIVVVSVSLSTVGRSERAHGTRGFTQTHGVHCAILYERYIMLCSWPSVSWTVTLLNLTIHKNDVFPLINNKKKWVFVVFLI